MLSLRTGTGIPRLYMCQSFLNANRQIQGSFIMPRADNKASPHVGHVFFVLLFPAITLHSSYLVIFHLAWLATAVLKSTPLIYRHFHRYRTYRTDRDRAGVIQPRSRVILDVFCCSVWAACSVSATVQRQLLLHLLLLPPERKAKFGKLD